MKAHRTDGVSLTFAVIFLGVVAWWLFAQIMNLTLPAIGWLVAAGLIGVGLLGLVGALRANRSGRRAAAVPAATAAESPAAPTGTDVTGTGPVNAPLNAPLDALLDPAPAGPSHERPTERFDLDPPADQFDRDLAGEADPYRTAEFDRPADQFDRDFAGEADPYRTAEFDRPAGDRTGDAGAADRHDERPT